MKLKKCFFSFCSTSLVCTGSKYNAKSFICMTFRFMKEYFDLQNFCKSKEKVTAIKYLLSDVMLQK